jgi:hypothetical protein
MTDSIREQILTAFSDRLAVILKTNQYNSDMGKTVLRSHLPAIDGSYCPAIGFHLDDEENIALYHREEQKELPIRVQGVAKFKTTTAAEMAELIYADICECILGWELSLNYDSGGTDEISPGDTITGETSGATGLVIAVSLDSGTWAGGDAAGTFTLRRVTGNFQDNEELSVGADTGAATVDGLLSGSGPLELTTNNLAEGITFSVGNVQMPDHDGTAVGVQIIFRVKYRSIAGNPYSQTI